jgi:hypothetical protein
LGCFAGIASDLGWTLVWTDWLDWTGREGAWVHLMVVIQDTRFSALYSPSVLASFISAHSRLELEYPFCCSYASSPFSDFPSGSFVRACEYILFSSTCPLRYLFASFTLFLGRIQREYTKGISAMELQWMNMGGSFRKQAHIPHRIKKQSHGHLLRYIRVCVHCTIL